VVPVEHRFSGGTVFKKPLPRDYGFSDESKVENAIQEEEKRTIIVNRISIFVFLAVFILISVTVLVIVRFIISPFSVTGDSTRFLVSLLYGMLSAGTGFVLGIFFALIARATSRRILQPSADYGKAKQYLDANWMWKQRLQREYGYESY
jgi:hypothetical protein